MKNIIISTAGHIDHGKSYLIKQLTGKITAHHKDEILRNMTIDLGYSHFEYKDLSVSMIDVPGHEDYLKNTICGIINSNISILVVSAKDGVCKQTIEHYKVIELSSKKNLIIAITKVDISDDFHINSTISQIHSLIHMSSITNIHICIADYNDATSLENLKEKIYILSQNISYTTNSYFVMNIDNSFSLKGHGTIISGNLIKGDIRKNEHALIYPQKIKTKIKNIQTHSKNIDNIQPFSRLAVNISNLSANSIKRGFVLSNCDNLSTTTILEVLIKSTTPVSNNTTIQLTTGTSTVYSKLINTISLQAENYISKYKNWTLAKLYLNKKIACSIKDDIILVDCNDNSKIYGGHIVNLTSSKKSKINLVIKDLFFKFDSCFSKHTLDYVIFWLAICSKKIFNLSYLSIFLNINPNTSYTVLQYFLKETLIVVLDLKDCQLLSPSDILSLDNVIIEQSFYKQIIDKLSIIIASIKSKNEHVKKISKHTIKSKIDYVDFDILNTILDINFDTDDEYVIICNNIELNSTQKNIYHYLLDEIKNSKSPILIKNLINNNISYKKILYEYCKDYFVTIDDDYICSKDNMFKYLDFINKHFELETKLNISEFKNKFALSRNMSVLILEYFDSKKITKRFDNYRIKLYNNNLGLY